MAEKISLKINESNIDMYFEQELGVRNVSILKKKTIPSQPLLQRDFGLKYDCTLTSLTFLINYLTKSKYELNAIYSRVEKEALKYGYNGNKSGTFPIFIKNIMNNTFEFFGIKYRGKSRYFKNVGYNWNTITSLIDQNKPVLLNAFNDGRKYYKDHTVTIVGYEIFSSENGSIKMLEVYDNWHKEICYIDYQKLCLISSINYY